MKTRITVTGLIIVFMFSLNSFAFARGGGKMHNRGKGEKGFMRHGRHHRIEELFERLELTSEQEEQVRKLIRGLKESKIKQMADIKIIGLDLEEEFLKKDIDRERVEKIFDDILEKRKAMMMTKLDLLIKFKEILTDEQNEKLRKIGPGFLRLEHELGGRPGLGP